MLIGKTANWLLRHSVQRCVKSRRLVCEHARNHAFCQSCPKCLIAVALSTTIYSIGLQKLSTYSHLRPLLATFILRMCRNGYLCTSGVNLDTAVRFADPDCLFECKISAIWRRFTLIFAFNILNVYHISTFGFFIFLTEKNISHASTPTALTLDGSRVNDP